MEHRANQCGITVLSRNPADRPPQPLILWPPGKGPGTSLKRRLSKIGIVPEAACECNGRCVQMDLWGVDGCRERREQIIEWMKQGAVKWGWQTNLDGAAIGSESNGDVPTSWHDFHAYCLYAYNAEPDALDAPVLAAAQEAWLAYQSDPEAGKPKTLTIGDKAFMGMRAAWSGLAFKVNWSEPWPGLVDMAISDAEAEVAETAK
jgi:hypothetical protein